MSNDNYVYEDTGEEIVGNRPLQRQRCLDMNWNNKKEITVKEIAYCIHHYNLNIDIVPDDRLRVVTKEIVKLQKQKKEEEEKKLIKAELAIYERIDDDDTSWLGTYSDEIVGYHLDPDLFKTSWEAATAMSELSSCWNHEMTKTEEYNHEYKNIRTYSKNFKRIKEAMDKVRQQYIKLGGIEAEFNKYISQIPMPQLGTLKQDIDENRERITRDFVSMEVSPTRAEKIAKAITTETYAALQ